MKSTINNLCADGTLNLIVAVILLVLDLILILITNHKIDDTLSFNFDVAFWANIILAELKANRK